MPKAEDFRRILTKYFQESQDAKQVSITLESGQVHRRVGSYPGSSHRMPMCCGVMKKMMQDGDELLYAPPSGKGASLKIRYKIPRKSVNPETRQYIKPRVSSPTLNITRKALERIEPVKGKVVCFIPCCGSKNPSGIIQGSTDSSTNLPELTSNRLTQARTQGDFVFDTDGPETAALELYTGSCKRHSKPAVICRILK
jgi:hypothetical protein